MADGNPQPGRNYTFRYELLGLTIYADILWRQFLTAILTATTVDHQNSGIFNAAQQFSKKHIFQSHPNHYWPLAETPTAHWWERRAVPIGTSSLCLFAAKLGAEGTENWCVKDMQHFNQVTALNLWRPLTVSFTAWVSLVGVANKLCTSMHVATGYVDMALEAARTFVVASQPSAPSLWSKQAKARKCSQLWVACLSFIVSSLCFLFSQGSPGKTLDYRAIVGSWGPHMYLHTDFYALLGLRGVYSPLRVPDPSPVLNKKQCSHDSRAFMQ